MPPPDDVEILRTDLPRGRFRGVLFDFDGTLSLIREGWPQVMIPMMVNVLRETGTPESDAELHATVEEFVMRLNGRQTIYQMMQLAEEVTRRGGRPREPLAYKHQYHDLLMARVQDRLTALESGAARNRRDQRAVTSHADHVVQEKSNRERTQIDRRVLVAPADQQEEPERENDREQERAPVAEQAQ